MGHSHPAPEILSTALVKLMATPVIVWAVAMVLYGPLGEAQYAAVVEGTTPTMLLLLLADRFRLDARASTLLIGWRTILFWISLPLVMALGLIR